MMKGQIEANRKSRPFGKAEGPEVSGLRKAHSRGQKSNKEYLASKLVDFVSKLGSILHKKFYLRILLPSALCLLTIFSCNETFEPFQKNDKFNFTVYGYLDASADTQWVRIAPVRGEFDMAPELPDMTVMLEDLETGQVETMNQKLVQFGQGFNAINVWSLMDIIPEKRYRLTAETDQGKVSQVSVTIPEPFPVPKLITISVPGLPTEYFLYMDDMEHLADVQSRWHYRVSTPFWEEERFHVFSLKSEVEEINGALGSYVVELDPDSEKELIMDDSIVLSQPDGKIEFLENQIFVASAGPEWDPAVSDIDDLVYFLPDGFSNISDGLGYMVGIFSRNIPFKTCLNEARELIGCPEVDPFF